MRTRRLILLFGLVNACLFSALLPLWEGFDEAFHYSYVETLRRTHQLPVLGQTRVPRDVIRTLELAPLSHVVARTVPEATDFATWFALPVEEKDRRRLELERVRRESPSSERPNYEAHQPPLAYLVLAPLDWLLAGAPITIRILVLRILGACAGIAMVFAGGGSLCRSLRVPDAYADAALYTIFCSEMLYATVAHVANDWLAVGVAALLFAALARFVEQPERRSAIASALWLSAGLLAKAYFLVFVPLFLVTLVWAWPRGAAAKSLAGVALLVLALAGPWYWRNLSLYGNVSGTQEQYDSIGVSQALAAAFQMDWTATTGYLARSSLWTGNNSFTSFSGVTLDILLVLLGVAIVVRLLRLRSTNSPERVTLAAIGLFCIAIAYASCASFAALRGQSAGASPWYPQVLLAPVLGIAYLGLSSWPRIGAALAALTVTAWTWVLVATWSIKLFPMYSGAGAAPMRLAAIWNWYRYGAAEHGSDLSRVALAPALFLYVAMILSSTLALWLAARTIRGLVANNR